MLYQTRHGAFFLLEVDHEGEEESFGPLTDVEAQKFLEEWKATDALEQCFGNFPEAGTAETRLTIRIPGNLATRVETAAKTKGMSLNSYAMRCFEHCVAADAKAQRPAIGRDGIQKGWTDDPSEADRDPFS